MPLAFLRSLDMSDELSSQELPVSEEVISDDFVGFPETCNHLVHVL